MPFIPGEGQEYYLIYGTLCKKLDFLSVQFTIPLLIRHLETRTKLMSLGTPIADGECQLQERKSLSVLLPIESPALKQCLAQSRCSRNVFWMNEYGGGKSRGCQVLTVWPHGSHLPPWVTCKMEIRMRTHNSHIIGSIVWNRCKGINLVPGT